MMSVRRPAATGHGKHGSESGREITNSEVAGGGRNARRACGLRAYHDYSINRRGMFTKFLDAASREPQRVVCGSSWARATGAC